MTAGARKRPEAPVGVIRSNSPDGTIRQQLREVASVIQVQQQPLDTIEEMFTKIQVSVPVRQHMRSWTNASESETDAFNRYKNRSDKELLAVQTENLLVYREHKYLQTYIMSQTAESLRKPIADFNDVYAFLSTSPDRPPDWEKCRRYQAWAYYDFMGERAIHPRKTYVSPGSRIQGVILPFKTLSPNVIFNISRNKDMSVYYERNDEQHTKKVRICDNLHAARQEPASWLTANDPRDQLKPYVF